MASKNKSVKISNIDNLYTVYRSIRPNGRYAKAWRSDDIEVKFFVTYGNIGMGADFSQPDSFDSIEELESEMRSFADLRKWSVDNDF